MTDKGIEKLILELEKIPHRRWDERAEVLCRFLTRRQGRRSRLDLELLNEKTNGIVSTYYRNYNFVTKTFHVTGDNCDRLKPGIDLVDCYYLKDGYLRHDIHPYLRCERPDIF